MNIQFIATDNDIRINKVIHWFNVNNTRYGLVDHNQSYTLINATKKEIIGNDSIFHALVNLVNNGDIGRYK